MSVDEQKLELMVGRTQYRVVLGLLRYHSVVWLDGLPIKPDKAVRAIARRAKEYDNMMVKCWPFEPGEEKNASRN